MKVVEYSLVTPDALGGQGDYRRLCRVAGLHPVSGGWGFLHCLTDEGERVTRVTSDLDYWRLLVESTPEVRAGLEVPAERFPQYRLGWPDDWIK